MPAAGRSRPRPGATSWWSPAVSASPRSGPRSTACSPERARFGRVALLYGTRSPAGILYPRELERWRSRLAQVEVTVDHAGLDWRGHVGVVTNLIPRAAFDPERTTALACGPDHDLRVLIGNWLNLEDDDLRWRCEQTVRNYDPCISCTTHFIRLKIDRG